MILLSEGRINKGSRRIGWGEASSLFFTLVLLSVLSLSCRAADELSGIRLEKIELPEDFTIKVFADDLPGARSLNQGEKGTVFVGSRDRGKVYALVDADGDGRSDRTHLIAEGLNAPNGVAFKDGDLYVAEISRVIKFPDIENRLDNPPAPVVVNDSFPDDTRHGWKFIRFGPDGLLYVPVGVPCNVCDPADRRFASIMRMKPDGSDLEIFARGIRNTVGFDWNPRTGVLWFTDNGRDWMGDNQPPDELNRAPEKGLHFGFPYCHGADILDPLHGEKDSCGKYVSPVQELGPHVAALGMRFYTGQMFPEEYRNQVFIAEHGSWNRTVPIGYRITLVRLDGEKAVSYEVFAAGWLREGDAWGRPVDVMVMPDGSLLVSDDRAGAVYRISYRD